MPATISAIDTGTDVITTSATHGFTTGWAVGIFGSDAATLPAATPSLSLSGVYYVRSTGAATLTLHATASAASAGTGAIDFSDDGTGTFTLERLTLRERIERNIVATLAAISGIGTVERWDQRINTRAALSVVIRADDETAVRDEQAYGTIMKYLPIDVAITLVQDEDGTAITSQLINRWLGYLEAALVADPQRTLLAHDTDVVGTAAPDPTTDQSECVATLQIEIQYRHPKTDPYSPI